MSMHLSQINSTISVRLSLGPTDCALKTHTEKRVSCFFASVSSYWRRGKLSISGQTCQRTGASLWTFHSIDINYPTKLTPPGYTSSINSFATETPLIAWVLFWTMKQWRRKYLHGFSSPSAFSSFSRRRSVQAGRYAGVLITTHNWFLFLFYDSVRKWGKPWRFPQCLILLQKNQITLNSRQARTFECRHPQAET